MEGTLKHRFVLLIAAGILSVVVVLTGLYRTSQLDVPITQVKCSHCFVEEEPITRINNTKHLMVSAFRDHRLNREVRIIAIIYRNEGQNLHCIFCNSEQRCMSSLAHVSTHSDHFGFPYVTSDVLCKIPFDGATHVTISTSTSVVGLNNARFLSIHNPQKLTSFRYNFTVCISNLFGDYDNVLQFAQTLEVYKILGVDKVIIYNTSCGPDLEKLLQHYKEEGTLETVPWPIDKFLTPSSGWNFAEHHGDLHYYGQLATLNDCIYRNMYRSKYLLLNDIDEIITPYKHANLQLLMDDLQQFYPMAGVFLIENHIFPKTQFEDSGKFQLPQWKNVKGINILEHIYREPDRKDVYNPTKMIVNPRKVEQTSVHTTLKQFGDVVLVPFDVCHIVHVRVPLQWKLTKDELIIDKKLWDYEKELVPNVDRALKESGLS
ncbi:uncharacterized protein LOC114799352 isoform X2 [Denticeps clupeoides]|nr:uncharacterized protein LOC114799352 isoform X2 [Denticeps clupeoides]XP_028851757.1 uncharacterized protein LOC114799352 isoform X2 [Denticeps clupeoides]